MSPFINFNECIIKKALLNCYFQYFERFFSVPAQPNFCGHVYAIMYTEQLAANQQQDEDENLKHNNFGIDEITLQCNPSGE